MIEKEGTSRACELNPKAEKWRATGLYLCKLCPSDGRCVRAYYVNKVNWHYKKVHGGGEEEEEGAAASNDKTGARTLHFFEEDDVCFGVLVYADGAGGVHEDDPRRGTPPVEQVRRNALARHHRRSGQALPQPVDDDEARGVVSAPAVAEPDHEGSLGHGDRSMSGSMHGQNHGKNGTPPSFSRRRDVPLRHARGPSW